MLKSTIQTYNDGIATIYSIVNDAKKGDMPHEALTAPVTARYEERTIGIKRHYSAQQVNANCDMLIRIQMLRDIDSAHNIAAIGGTQYRILQAQHLTTSDGADVTDLSLMAIGDGDKYDIA